MSLRRLIQGLALVGLVLITSNTQARELREFYNGIRPLGMGNAFVAISNDYNALYYNPAGLEYRTKGRFSAFLRAEMSADAKKILDAMKKDSAADIGSELNNLRGERGTLGLGIDAAYVRAGFGLGIMVANTQLTYQVKSTGPIPEVAVRAVSDTHIVYAYTRSFFKKRLLFGVSPRLTLRLSDEKSVGPVQIASSSLDLDQYGEGVGVDANIGIIYRMPVVKRWLKPRFGLVIKNILASKFGKSLNLVQDKDIRPEPNKRKMDIGVALQPMDKVGPFTLRWAFDVKNIGEKYGDERFTKHYHTGLELQTKWASWAGGAIRVGINQAKYFTAGLSGYLGIFRYDFATYEEELGAFPGQIGDRRYAAQIGLYW